MALDLLEYDDYLDTETERERAAAAEKRDRYRGDRDPPDLRGKAVLVVDDGVATGVTTTACLRAVTDNGAGRVVLVGPPGTIERLRTEADEVACVETPPHFGAVGQFYKLNRAVLRGVTPRAKPVGRLTNHVSYLKYSQRLQKTD